VFALSSPLTAARVTNQNDFDVAARNDGPAAEAARTWTCVARLTSGRFYNRITRSSVPLTLAAPVVHVEASAGPDHRGRGAWWGGVRSVAGVEPGACEVAVDDSCEFGGAGVEPVGVMCGAGRVDLPYQGIRRQVGDGVGVGFQLARRGGARRVDTGMRVGSFDASSDRHGVEELA